MIAFDSLETIMYTCIFLLPGYIIKNIIDIIVPPNRISDLKYIFLYLLYSIVNLAIWSWGYIIIYNLLKDKMFLYWIILVFFTIVSSGLLAFFYRNNKTKRIC